MAKKRTKCLESFDKSLKLVYLYIMKERKEILEEKIAHHEKEARQWVEVIKTVDTPQGLLLALDYLKKESKQIALLVAESRGWGQTSIHHL